MTIFRQWPYLLRHMASRLGILPTPIFYAVPTPHRPYSSLPRSLTQQGPKAPKLFKSSQPSEPKSEGRNDFRPPWFFTGTRVATALIIPAVAFYAIFFNDFGDYEHVFMPARRWAARQKVAFFELSPAEREMVKADSTQARQEKGVS